MGDCRWIAERLTSYADGSLATAECADVERHLAGCPPCRVGVDREQCAREAVRRCAPRLQHGCLPPGFATRCQALAKAHAGGSTRRTVGARLLRAFATGAAVVVVMGALLWFATTRSTTVLAAQLTADHVKCFKLFGDPSESEADVQAIEAMLASRFGRTIHVPPSSRASGVTLIGARRCVSGEGSVPHLMYRVNGTNVSLFMLDGTPRTAAHIETFGHRARVWTQGATTFVLVSPQRDELMRAVDYLRRAAS